jgi:cyclopropane-fatty-acyl-phospholipid synthase
MNRLLEHVIARLVKTGNLKVTSADGSIHRFGDGTGPEVHVALRSRRAEWAIGIDPMLALPESYMEGNLDFVSGDAFALLETAYRNYSRPSAEAGWTRMLEGMRRAFRRLQQVNTAARARQNVRHHYDLSGEFYRLFLDADMQYSCAYFPRQGISLDEAQAAKKRHLAAKLRLTPGQRILDIGSGWGGLGLYLAKQFETEVLGVTLSVEQHQASNERARRAGLAERARFELQDYRALEGPFDRIVSVGMFEHVGINHYRTFFDTCARLLTPDGVMVLHSIGRSGTPQATAAFIRKYIFPGGYIPSLSDVFPAIERSGLIVTDVEILRLHYAETLRLWRERFAANRDHAKEMYGERFCRMWEFYLAGSEASFRWQDLIVFQLQLTRRNDTLPITRDYMAEAEKALTADSQRGKRGRPKFTEAAE